MKDFEKIFMMSFVRALQSIGGEVFVVGGCVRDAMLGKKPKDIDIIVRCLSVEEISDTLQPYGKVDLVGESFGVIKFNSPYGEFDIALPRSDAKIPGAKGHKSISVQSDKDMAIEEDLLRRDFTINAMAVDRFGKVIDPYNGQQHLSDQLISCVSIEAFPDDPLRMLRALQFAARFDFDISDETVILIRANAHLIKEISPDRVLTEFEKVFDKNGNVSKFAHLLNVSGLWEEYFGFKMKHERMVAVNFLSELLYFAMAELDNVPHDFFKERLHISTEIYKQMEAIHHVYGTPMTEGETIYHKLFNSFRKSQILLNSDFLQDSFKEPFISGEFPTLRKDLAVSGDDLLALGIKPIKIGSAIEECLTGIFNRELRNERTQLLEHIKNNITRYEN